MGYKSSPFLIFIKNFDIIYIEIKKRNNMKGGIEGVFYVFGFCGEDSLDCYETCNTREEAEEVLNELLANNDSDEKFGIYTDEGWEATIY